jgi:hypothetical protein
MYIVQDMFLQETISIFEIGSKGENKNAPA